MKVILRRIKPSPRFTKVDSMSMRNDANDDFDDVPSLRADILDDDDFPKNTRTTMHSRTPPVVKVKAASTGPLWALVGALFFAFAGLAWCRLRPVAGSAPVRRPNPRAGGPGLPRTSRRH